MRVWPGRIDETVLTPGDCISYYTQPAEQTGGSNVVTGISIPDATNCVPEVADFKWHTSSTEASTIDDALTVAALGFSASAQTGWSNSDTLYYQDTDDSAWHLCGLNDYPAGNPGKVVAGVPG